MILQHLKLVHGIHRLCIGKSCVTWLCYSISWLKRQYQSLGLKNAVRIHQKKQSGHLLWPYVQYKSYCTQKIFEGQEFCWNLKIASVSKFHGFVDLKLLKISIGSYEGWLNSWKFNFVVINDPRKTWKYFPPKISYRTVTENFDGYQKLWLYLIESLINPLHD